MTLIETDIPVMADGQTQAEQRRYFAFVDDRPDWLSRGSLAALLVATAFLYVWGLSASGYANSFYSAAAQAGSENWVAWFFGSLDGGNSITVDKPPASIWLMALSVRLFGLSSQSILVPEALLGVASVGVLYSTVRRSLLAWRHALGQTHPLTARGAHWAALAGAAVFALTPVATLMFRFNNPDALLVFTMVAASYFTVRAAETASRGWLALAGVAIGFGFLTKMLQAFIVLPALVVAYWIAAPAAWRKKLLDLFVAFLAVIASAGWYVAIVELTPASLRPYIGGSQTNSLLELILSYNGLGRITGNEVGSVGGSNSRWGETGVLRMFEGVSGGMVSWLIPAALVLGLGALGFVIAKRHASASPAGESASTLAEPARKQGTADAALTPGATHAVLTPHAGTHAAPTPHTATDGRLRQTPSQALAGGLALWLGWLVVTAGIFSFMGGIYHDYYTVALAPAIGGAVALGGAALWTFRGYWPARVLLAVSSAGTGAWALLLLQRAGGGYLVLGWTVFGAGLAAGLALGWVHRLPRVLAGVAMGVAFAAGLAGPYAYSINTATTAHTGSIVTAGPVSASRGGGGAGRGGGQPPSRGQDGQTQTSQTQDGETQDSRTQTEIGQSPVGRGTTGAGASRGGGTNGLLNGAATSAELVNLLSTDASSYTWVAATVGAQNAASYQLASKDPVMAIGGFNGSDPSPTLAQFTQYVAEGKIHYFLGGDLGGRQNGGSDAAGEIAAWVADTFTATTVGGTTVYDLTSGS